MLKTLEVAQSVGVRVLLIHAKGDEAKSFYMHYGFVESPIDPLVLMMLLGELSPTPEPPRWSASGSKAHERFHEGSCDPRSVIGAGW